jgi:hypothetical protein
METFVVDFGKSGQCGALQHAGQLLEFSGTGSGHMLI